MADLIPRDFIQQLLDKVDIVDFIDGRIPLLKKSGSNYFACCPFHGEKTPSFSVSQSKQFYYCFGCGAHGNAIDFLIQHDRLEFPEAVEALARHVGVEVPRESRNSVQHRPAIASNAYELLEQVNKYYQQQLKQSQPTIDYLKKRGISGAIAKMFEIGYCPAGWDHVLQAFGKTAELKKQLFDVGMLIKKDDGGYYDRFRERIMFPIRDRRGRIIGFGGRIIDKGDPKYLNSPETPIFQKGHELYGLYQALQANRKLDRVIIVEGYMDTIALFQHDLSYAVATLGTATSANHIQRLFRYTSEIIFCFDGDNAGRNAAWRALLVTLPLMRDDIQVRFMFLPEGEDPDSLIRKEGKAEFEQRIQQAATLSHFFFQSISAQTDLSHMDGRARLIKLAMEHINQLPPGIFQQMMLEELAKRAQINDVKQLKPIATDTAQRRTSKPKALPPSALRLALTLLLQQPELASLINPPLPTLNIRGFNLLNDVIALLQENPTLTTGALLEHWRDKEEGKLLAKLTQTEHMIPEKGIQSEFLGSIQNLRNLSKRQAIDHLLAKASQMTLTQEEKEQLNELIHNKEISA